MAYITPIHTPSAIRNALKLELISPGQDTLAVARSNRIEIYTINTHTWETETENVLSLVSSTRIFGRVTSLNKFKPADSMVEHLFVGTDLCNYFMMHWDQQRQNLVTTEGTEMKLLETNAQRAEFERSTIDPTKEFLLLEVFEGIITTIPLARRVKKQIELGIMGQPAPARITELNVRSSAFIQRPLPPKNPPRIVLLSIDHEDKSWLHIRQVEYAGPDSGVEYGELKDDSLQGYDKRPLDYGASHLIPITDEPYGLLVLGETSISYFSDEDYRIKFQTALQKPAIWATWERVDSQRYILADIYGELSLLMLEMDLDQQITAWKLDPLGKTSQATCLIHLDGGIVFIGSHQGDSQVVKIRSGKIEGGKIELVQTIPNLGPILDFTVMDMGNRSEEGHGSEFSTGQARIVTGSGAWVDGSIRSVRSGVGLQNIAELDDLEHVTHLFGLRLDPSSRGEKDSLFVSFVDESRLYHFDDQGNVSELVEEEAFGLILDQETIHAANMGTDRLLQATSISVEIINLNGRKAVSNWSPPAGSTISAISTTDNLVAVSLDGKALVILDTSRNLAVIKQRNFEDDQISCIHLQPRGCFVGYWDQSTLDVLDISSLDRIQTIRISETESVVPRAILVTKIFHQGSDTLLISLADGHVVTFDINQSSFITSNRKSTILGTRESDLQELPLGNGVSAVFVSSEHPSLLYDEAGRMAFSAVNAGRVNAVCSFDNSNFPSAGQASNRCVALASSKLVSFANIDSGRTTQVQPLKLGETVRRISYSPSLKVFALGTIKRTIEDVGGGAEEVTASALKLADEIQFKELDCYNLHQNELIETVLCMKCSDGYGEQVDRFIVGTSFLEGSTTDGLAGRIIVFEVTEDRKLRIATQMSTKAACRRLIEVQGHIAAGFDKNLFVYSIDYTTGATPYLKKRARYPVQTVIIDLAVDGNEIICADLVKSIHVLEYKRDDPENAGRDSLTEVARHYQTVWSTAVGLVDKNTYLVSDFESNLVVVERNPTGLTIADRQRLMPISEFRLGEGVNKIQSIDVRPSPGAAVVPKAFIATVSTSYNVMQAIY